MTSAIDSRTTSSARRDVRRRPLHELDRDVAPVHLLRDLRAGAVHDDELVALLTQAEDPVDGLGGDGTAHLHDEPRHERYSALIRT